MVLAHIAEQDTESLSTIAAETAGDTIYAVDRVSEEGLLTLFEREFGQDTSIILIGEGLSDFGEVIPAGVAREEAAYRVIVDPIDGTRGLMYDKRSAWILTGVAENKGEGTSVEDIFVAVQTEIPTTKQYRSDVLWAIEGDGWGAEGVNVLNGEVVPITLKPTKAESIEHGFAMISRFFPGGKAILAEVEEALVERLIGPVVPGKARLFEDQYICSGGQFYELMVGHDRFNADLRPLLDKRLEKEGKALGICCHPYDVCTVLIAKEMGIVVEKPNGKPIDAPLDTTSPVAWVGYGNTQLKEAIAPVLKEVLDEQGLSVED
ncbi:MAG: inositol monophosphatase [Candidatus Latescibacteria bacterium]|nr:inositol monophosphatase [Candidatus Latescibacterota bacterium]MBT4141258.1 inositol monophosphatase [Candidatus Latescibacterota bacterium]MBT5829118.1 inositol monophosphatase [Candidatus Latescibacterota bacterium]